MTGEGKLFWSTGFWARRIFPAVYMSIWHKGLVCAHRTGTERVQGGEFLVPRMFSRSKLFPFSLFQQHFAVYRGDN